jgi:hypothetical protein
VRDEEEEKEEKEETMVAMKNDRVSVSRIDRKRSL